MRLFISIPKESWESFKQDFLTTWFNKTPTLKHHGHLSTDEAEYATFYTESVEDFHITLSKIPVGGVAIDVEALHSCI